MDEKKTVKRNLWMYPLGTVGRDMVYQLFNSFIMTYILLTKLSDDTKAAAAQLSVIAVIMIASRIFDAINDPIMGFIIEKTKTKWGKFKPWLVIGMIATAGVIIAMFNIRLTGWAFIPWFAVLYFLYSIAYTMHDISYWGMVPALSSDANARNQFTSRATLFAGVGFLAASTLIPIFTSGSSAIAKTAQDSYGIISIAIVLISLVFICFTIFGVKEDPNVIAADTAPKKRRTLKETIKVIFSNKPLLWVSIAFIIQQIGNGLIAEGMGSTYIYLTYGYQGGKYSIFSTIGVAATAILMVTYPMICKKISRKKLMGIMLLTAAVGSVLMLLTGFVLPGSDISYWIMVVGYMLSNFGQYGFYLVMMVSIMNTVEYNEYTSGDRDEALISSVRPFATKLAAAVIAGISSLSFIMFGVSEHTNKITELERQAVQLGWTDAFKEEQISNYINGIDKSGNMGLLLVMVILPFVLLAISYFIYKKKYTLDEEEYERICNELKDRKETPEAEVVAE